MTISQQIKLPIWNKDAKWDTKMMLCWHCSLHGTMLFLFPFLEWQRWWRCYCLFLDSGFVHCHCQVQTLVLEGTALLAVIIGDMMICIAPFTTAWARAKKETLTRSNSFSGWSVCTQRREVVVVHDLILLYKVIRFAVISLLVGLFLESFFWQRVWSLRQLSRWWLLCWHLLRSCWLLWLWLQFLQQWCLWFKPWLQATGRWAVFFSFGCLFSFTLPRKMAALSAALHCSSKATSQRGSVGTILFVSGKICLLFSCAVGNYIVWRR